MSFIEAHRILKTFSGGPPLPLLVAMSGTSQQLDIYLRACGAVKGYTVETSYLPFGTLGQHLHLKSPDVDITEVLLLAPWDFVPILDWRLGLPEQSLTLQGAQQEAKYFAALLKQRRSSVLVYLPAAIPLPFPNAHDGTVLDNWIKSLSASLGAWFLNEDAFTLGNYLATGCPIAGNYLGEVATTIIDAVLSLSATPSKILVTDLDNVLWSGVIAEDGLEGIIYGAEGQGYRHYIYQSFLRQLRQEGVLLVALSRNDARDAIKPLRSGKLLLSETDFVEVIAGYDAKSQEIRALSERLNLGLDSIVFVDDNPVELAEVAAALPQVKTFMFPAADNLLPTFLRDLRRAFSKTTVTAEDRGRTEMYRRRAATQAPKSVSGTDLTAFLRDLRMVLTIHDRTRGPFTRAVQLINKTTQFNLNGNAISEGDLALTLDNGGRLYTAYLTDRAGDHGEILAFLISGEGVVESFVMSCRVFQRHVEHAFLTWLAGYQAPRSFKFFPTERNGPIRTFLSDPAFDDKGSGLFDFDGALYCARHKSELELFDLKTSIACNE